MARPQCDTHPLFNLQFFCIFLGLPQCKNLSKKKILVGLVHWGVIFFGSEITSKCEKKKGLILSQYSHLKISLPNFEKKELLEKLSPHLDFAFNLVTVFQLF